MLFCADIDLERAKEQAARYGVPEAGTVAEALREPDVELVVNLTIPAAHAEVTSAALAAGKSVWTEKPLALDTATGQRLLAEADRAGLRLGCAPDTVLGAGLQTARRLIAAGAIGVPQTALALMQNPGPEWWHPDPAVPVPARRGTAVRHRALLPVLAGHDLRPGRAGRGRRPPQPRHQGHRQRAAGRHGVPRRGPHPRLRPDRVRCRAPWPRSCSASSRRCRGTVSWRSPAPRPPSALPDPNRFDGEIRLRATGADEWQVLPTSGATDGRGLGVLDMARALRGGGRPRASGELGLHVLETMEAIERSVAERSFEPVRSTFSLPETLDPDLGPEGPNP